MKEYIIAEEFLDGESMQSAKAQGYLHELIRCKDCKHHGKSSGEYCLKDGCYGWFDNDWCSRAERKEE